LAATAVAGEYKIFALQIALVHLLYNFSGVISFMIIPFLRELPIRSAQWLGTKSADNRGWAFGYILTVFFVLPGAVLGGDALFWPVQEEIATAIENKAQLDEAIEAILEEGVEVE
jgi:sodium-dependent phosphate cotransporter